MSKYHLFMLLVSTLTVGCGGDDHHDDAAPSPAYPVEPTLQWYQPPVASQWQWQLQGELNLGYDVTLYDVDLFDTSRATIAGLQQQGRRVICYFSAGSYEDWRPDAEQFVMADLGDTLAGWEDERWLDIRSDHVLQIMTQRLNLAAEKGCDGVEPDNVDAYTNNSGFNLSYDDQLAFNQQLAVLAHERGLAIGLKNDLDQVTDLVDDFDFAVNEQCFQYQECDQLTPFILNNKPVFNAEYADAYVNNPEQRRLLCEQANTLAISTLILPEALDDSFRFSCQE